MKRKKGPGYGNLANLCGICGRHFALCPHDPARLTDAAVERRIREWAHYQDLLLRLAQGQNVRH